MATHGIVSVDLFLPGQAVANLAATVSQCTTDPERLRRQIVNWAGASSVGFGGVGLVARVRGVTPTSASSSFTTTFASMVVGDKLVIIGPAGPVTLTCVTSGSENPFIGTYSGTTNDTLTTSIRAAINNYPPAKAYCTAAGSTNTVALTSVLDGAFGNDLKLVKQVTTAGVFSFTSGVAFASGISLTSTTNTVTVAVQAVANDTLRIGNVLLTWKAAAANENEVTIGGTTTISAANLAAKINAHSILGGLMVATTASNNIVTNTVTNPGLVHSMLYFVSSTANVTVSAQLAAGLTYTGSTATASTAGVF